MRRSAAVTMLVFAIIASACGGGGRETPQFSIPDEIEGRVEVPEGVVANQCVLAIGTGMGAEVVEVAADVPASGLLEPGDIITEADGLPVTGPAQLVDVVGAKQVGDVVELRATRRGSGPIEADVALVETTDGSGSPMLGVVIRTSVELQNAGAVDVSGSLDSPHSTVMSIEGNLLAVDAVEGIWLNLETAAPEGLWVPVAGSVYLLDDGSAEGSLDRIVDVTDPQASVEFFVEGWDGRSLLGTQDGQVLVMASRLVDNQSQFAVFAVDPASGALRWSVFPDDAERTDYPQPVFALSTPSQDRTLIVTVQGDAEGNIEVLRFNLIDLEGNIVLPVPGGDGSELAGFTLVGWHSDSEVAYHDPITGNVMLWNVDTGDLTPLELPAPTAETRLVPVGDGDHFIVVGDDSVNLIGLGEGVSSRRLVVGCDATVAPPGGFVG